MNTGAISGVVLSRVLSRYIGLPAAIAMTLISAHRAHRAYGKLKDLETELLDPLKNEASKWSAAISQLNGARDELTYSQRRHFPEFTVYESQNVRNAVSTESAIRSRSVCRTTSRSTTTEISWFSYRFSSGGSERSWVSPSTRTRTKPSFRARSNRSLNSPFRPRTRGA